MRALQTGLLLVLTAVVALTLSGLLLSGGSPVTRDAVPGDPANPGIAEGDGHLPTIIGGLESACAALGGAPARCTLGP